VLAGRVIEVGRGLASGVGAEIARQILRDGLALRKFEAICDAQGGMRAPPVAPYTHTIEALRAGTISSIDNRRLARVAKLAGAPAAKAAGLELLVRLDDKVAACQPLFTLHAESPGELEYARSYASENEDIFTIEKPGAPIP
jgi:thymidine phosphorylase